VPRTGSSYKLNSQSKERPATSLQQTVALLFLLSLLASNPITRSLPLKNSPVRPLLVQYTVPALFAADGVAALQRHFVVAVAAQVVHRALCVFETGGAGLEACVGGAGRAEVGLSGAGLFARHGCEVLWCWWLWIWWLVVDLGLVVSILLVGLDVASGTSSSLVVSRESAVWVATCQAQGITARLGSLSTPISRFVSENRHPVLLPHAIKHLPH
jgi:hypothetical protein